MAIRAGYTYDYDGDGCCHSSELLLDCEDGELIEVSEEIEQRWRQAYEQWLVVKGEIDSELQRIESLRIKHINDRRLKEYPHLQWFEEHNRKLREDPSYCYPYDTIEFNGVSYSVSNKRG